MAFIKRGEAVTITTESIQSVDNVVSDPKILAQFEKVASDLKMIAPKAKDFLYFSAVMMHAAEASILDENGAVRKDAQGNNITCGWEKSGDSWRWACSDSSILPYKNSNNDIFPEEELLKAYKKWIGRPLCLDHQSSSVDMVRGVIVDTYYDYPNKRVVALCALDKVSYPELARKVATGVSASVSMGTAVGRAICTECGNVAKTEGEFCEHMRSKSCYGEINVDLNPIELSIVVNGADPKAKIRHIVAAAESIAQYVSSKEEQISKMADMHEMVDPDEVKDITEELEGVLNKLKDLQETAKRVEEEEEAEEEHEEHEEHEVSSDEDEEDANDEKCASGSGEDIKKLAGVLDNIYKGLNKLQDDVDQLSQNKKEDIDKMTKKEAYFQGGGGPNEPGPSPRYPIEDAESIRDLKDKQMVGQMDTGPVEGMHPGPESTDKSEEERKRELQRLAEEREQRSLKRQAVVAKAKEAFQNRKEAYFQGGGGPNEPTPGKPTYEKEDYAKTRDGEDKQMVGEKPFPGVGDVEGLYGDDEKKKQMLARAKLTAKFIKAADVEKGEDDKANSRWQVYSDNKLILSSTVSDITNGKVDALYDFVATEKFGRKILDTIRTEGFDKAQTILKGAQAPELPTPPPEEAELPEGAEEAVEMDEGFAGDVREQIPDLMEDVENAFADLRNAVNTLLEGGDELSSFEELEEEEVEEGEPTFASLVEMQKKLSAELVEEMNKTAGVLEEQAEELRLVKHIYDNKEKLADKDIDQFNKLAANTCSDTKETLADHYKLLESFVKYAHGTEELVKKAEKHPLQEVYEKNTKDQKPVDRESKIKHDPSAGSGPYNPAEEAEEKDPKGESTTGREVKRQKAKADDADDSNDAALDDLLEMLEGGEEAPEAPEDANPAAIEAEVPLSGGGTATITGDPVDVGKAVSSAEDKPDLSTKEGRAAYREELEKLAQTGLSFNPVLDEAHPQGGTTTQLDVPPEGELAKTETLEEAHDKVMDVATAPPKVRKMAEDIQKMVVEGKIDPEKDFDGLIAAGLDADAVAYWKKFFGEAGAEGSQFASELVKEHAKAANEADKEKYQVKIARAYELAYDMVGRGMIQNTRPAVKEQVEELMSFNDEAFESMKRWVDRQPSIQKNASLPQVGLMSTGDSIALPAPEAAQNEWAELNKIWAGKKL